LTGPGPVVTRTAGAGPLRARCPAGGGLSGTRVAAGTVLLGIEGVIDLRERRGGRVRRSDVRVIHADARLLIGLGVRQVSEVGVADEVRPQRVAGDADNLVPTGAFGAQAGVIQPAHLHEGDPDRTPTR